MILQPSKVGPPMLTEGEEGFCVPYGPIAHSTLEVAHMSLDCRGIPSSSRGWARCRSLMYLRGVVRRWIGDKIRAGAHPVTLLNTGVKVASLMRVARGRRWTEI